MKREKIDELKRLLSEATQGDWMPEMQYCAKFVRSGEIEVAACGRGWEGGEEVAEANAALICEMHNSLSELLGEIEKLQDAAETNDWILVYATDRENENNEYIAIIRESVFDKKTFERENDVVVKKTFEIVGNCSVLPTDRLLCAN